MALDRIEKKEDVKKIIDSSTDYKELYDNSIKILQRMESSFKGTLVDVANKEKWESQKRFFIRGTVFDDTLDTRNPVTIFEKKGKDLLERSKNISENNKVLNAGIQVAKRVGVKRLDDRSKQIITDELWSTRLDAIQDFKNDVADGVLSNSNNVSLSGAEFIGLKFGEDLFELKLSNQKIFEKIVNGMPLQQLAYTTFSMYQGGFIHCYEKLKEKLGNKGLFDYIDSLKKPGDQTSEILKYSALKMLFHQGQADDLKKWLDGYKDKKKILNYVRSKLRTDEGFKLEFLQGIKKLEKVPYFLSIANELKQSDPKVREAYEQSANFDNIDVFKNKKVNALAVYDNEGHGGGGAFFKSELEGYKRQGFTEISSEDNSNYSKYVLQKGVDKVTMVKLKDCSSVDEVQKALTPIVKNVDYNLFALRGHCYNTSKMARSLGHLNVVQENDIFIDGGCWGAQDIQKYYEAGVKGQMFAYTGTGKGASTQAFINRIIKEKSTGKTFSEVMAHYDNFNNESSIDGYFALNVERPDSVAYKYKILTSEKGK